MSMRFLLSEGGCGVNRAVNGGGVLHDPFYKDPFQSHMFASEGGPATCPEVGNEGLQPKAM